MCISGKFQQVYVISIQKKKILTLFVTKNIYPEDESTKKGYSWEQWDYMIRDCIAKMPICPYLLAKKNDITFPPSKFISKNFLVDVSEKCKKNWAFLRSSSHTTTSLYYMTSKSYQSTPKTTNFTATNRGQLLGYI